MTDHSLPDAYDEFDALADSVMAITILRGQGTGVRREIAKELREYWEKTNEGACR